MNYMDILYIFSFVVECNLLKLWKKFVKTINRILMVIFFCVIEVEALTFYG
jgi:hypothetical protein